MDQSLARLRTILCGWFVLKFLLSYCYVSTDFEVHRNWLSITYNLPISQWYLENTSIWTLDYPPFFAWFEFGLARIGALFLLNGSTTTTNYSQGPLGIRPESIDLQSDIPTLIFQRMTVIATDLIYVWASIDCARFIVSYDGGAPTKAIATNRKSMAEIVVAILLCTNVGLLFVDNIHFQYNGFLFGVLLISITSVGRGRFVTGAFVFAVLLNLKHIYLYLAPAYAAYFLRNYCFDQSDGDRGKNESRSKNGDVGFKRNLAALIRTFSIVRFVKLILVGVIVFAVSLGPFVAYGQLPQLLSRLFPFKRGLTHACWAPNFWALYNAVDYVLAKLGHRDGIPGYTTGLVQEFDHVVLPTIKPMATFVITVLSMMPACSIVVCKRTNWTGFVTLITLCAFSSFLFGWHVHEKAVLLITIPLTLLAIYDRRYAKSFLLSSIAGYFSLFPLLFQQFESPIKYTAFAVFVMVAFWGLQSIYLLPIGNSRLPRLPFLNCPETLYVCGFVPLELVCTLIDYHPVYAERYAFAPLMLTSIYCAIAIVYCWLIVYWTFLCKELNVNTFLLMRRWRRVRSNLKTKLVTTNCEDWQRDPNFDGLEYVIGLDVSTAIGDQANAIGCLAVLSFPDLKVVHSICERVVIDAPYVPGFLAFREAPIMISLVRRLEMERPDLPVQVLFVDGNGLLHPDRFGLACHVGVSLDIPCVGVAKDLHLVDGILREEKELLVGRGSSLVLSSTIDGRALGAALRAGDVSKNAIYVSVGHRIDLVTAVALSSACSKHRVPEPIRAADTISRERVRMELS